METQVVYVTPEPFLGVHPYLFLFAPWKCKKAVFSFDREMTKKMYRYFEFLVCFVVQVVLTQYTTLMASRVEDGEVEVGSAEAMEVSIVVVAHLEREEIGVVAEGGLVDRREEEEEDLGNNR